MELTKNDIRRIINSGMLNIETLGDKKGATVIIYDGKAYYVWKNESTVFFQKRWIWSKRHKFEISAVGT